MSVVLLYGTLRMIFIWDHAFNSKQDAKYISVPFLLKLNVLEKKIFFLALLIDSTLISKARLMSLLSGTCDRRQETTEDIVTQIL